ncbi:hypothetical protein RB195_000423 [Necator americanus]|uniref:Chromo domain-containing protein n=1 Tax=Necator americanus TaxID=51031 RepID=A0ABR1DAW8_NECAM
MKSVKREDSKDFSRTQVEMEFKKTAPKRKSKRASLVKATENMKSACPKRKNREQEYEVEDILSHEFVDGETVYTVTWVGYPGEVTELTDADLKNCGELVQKYWERVNKDDHSLPEKSIEPHHLSETINASERKHPPSTTETSVQEDVRVKISNNLGRNLNTVENGSTLAISSIGNTTKKKSSRNSTEQTTEKGSLVFPTKRPRKPKLRPIPPDSELGYNNGCIVDEYKGFSTKYTEPVVLVTYKEPLPKGFEDRQDEIVPVRIIAEKDPQKLIVHLVDLLSNNRGTTSH